MPQLVEIQVPQEIGVGDSKPAPVQQKIRLMPACDEAFRIANIRASLQRQLPQINEQDFHGRLAVVVGFGPSLKQTWEELRRLPEPADIFTVSGAHSFLAERGIPIYGHAEVDPRDHKHRLLTTVDRNCRFFIASRCHPTMFDRLLDDGCDVRVFHTGRQDPEMRAIRDIYHGAQIVSPASMVGVQTIQLTYFLGYRRWRLYGLDCSFNPAEGQHAGEHPHRDPNEIPVVVGGRQFTTTMSMICSATDYLNIASSHPMGSFDPRGDGMLQWMDKVSRGAVPEATVSPHLRSNAHEHPPVQQRAA